MNNPQMSATSGSTTQSTSSQSSTTGADNTLYDLVSVLYHALQSASAQQQYQRDASGSGPQIAQFFRSVQDGDRQRVNQAKEMLRQYLSSTQTTQG